MRSKIFPLPLPLILWPLAIVLIFSLANWIHSLRIKPNLNLSQEELSYTINENLLSVFSMGQQRLIADYLWAYTMLMSDIEHLKPSSKYSWMYYRFKTISKLDPHFYENYKIGGIYLSVAKDDINGSIAILKEGIKYYPDDFWINYYLGFNYLHELKDHKNALHYFSKIVNHPLARSRFTTLISTVARLHHHHGDSKIAYNILLEAYKNLEVTMFKKHFEKVLYSLKANIDLKCLNKTPQKNCSKVDFLGKPYYKDPSGIYRSVDKARSLKLK